MYANQCSVLINWNNFVSHTRMSHKTKSWNRLENTDRPKSLYYLFMNFDITNYTFEVIKHFLVPDPNSTYKMNTQKRNTTNISHYIDLVSKNHPNHCYSSLTCVYTLADSKARLGTWLPNIWSSPWIPCMAFNFLSLWNKWRTETFQLPMLLQ